MPPPPPPHSSSAPTHSGQQHRLRSLRGCWTCRLRRKKCDETRPVCTTCSTLEVTCHYGEAKPAWMDGGRREKEKTAEIKAMIKARAGERRERKWAVYLDPPQAGSHDADIHHETEGARVEGGTIEDSSGPPSFNASMEAVAGADCASSSSSPWNTANHGHEPHQTATPHGDTGLSTANQLPSPESQKGGGSTRSPRWLDEIPADVRTTLLSTSHGVDDLELERETNNIMIYLDHVVPFFYPFYRPALISGSRGWQLYLLFKDRTIFHTALSLAAYFLTVVFHTTRNRPALRPETHTACQGAAWADLVKHQELAIRTLQADVARLSGESSLRESIRGLQSIVQLLEFEMAIARKPDADGNGTRSESSSWLPHLDAALDLFNQILGRQRAHDEDSAGASPHSSLPSGSLPATHQKQRHPWHSITYQLSHLFSATIIPPRLNFKPPLSNSESALHFYTARLLYIDIIAGTTLNRVPLLEPHHAALLQGDFHDHDQGEDDNDNGSGPAIDLAEHIGIENWALLATARVTSLSVWKAQMRSQGALSVVELVRRAGAIEADVRAGIARLAPLLTGPTQGSGGSKTFSDPSDFSAGQHHATRPIATSLSSSSAAAVALHTTIHARAALIYLSSTTSGLQPGLAEIQDELSHVLRLIRLLPSASCLRTLLWAFTVAGCVAITPEQRTVFDDVVDKEMGDMGIFGGVRESLAVLRAVWGVRDCGAVDGCGGDSEMIGSLGDWSLAGCLNILGHPSLPA